MNNLDQIHPDYHVREMLKYNQGFSHLAISSQNYFLMLFRRGMTNKDGIIKSKQFLHYKHDGNPARRMV